ncbi:hypothetical protein JDV02_005612 [Purpureocillium takamizusanense]|uniref:Uncharacterized protein n=1 Tax=Purpureocillium takamizusanense TaxID=2060973 RepID=A0A9Q8VB88_9HYPO|nr:uncharacterized protein JDV02_005612 [Purpureocillium takamizusanense]UNI19428.1 hypothetical protein JDV02_005612 [Purpureocillium takamizusanense]
MRTPTAHLGFGLLGLLHVSIARQVRLSALKDTTQDRIEASSWCDRGCYEAEALQTYRSFDAAAPKVEVVLANDRCDGGLTFIEPDGWQAYGSGLAVFDGRGDLVWTPTRWAETRDARVQSFDNALYMTFWVRDGDSDVGHYIMLDETYTVVKEIRPGGGIYGDVQSLLITDDGTAIITIDLQTKRRSRTGASTRHDHGSVFQEIDLESGALIFEWHASDHPTDSSEARHLARTQALPNGNTLRYGSESSGFVELSPEGQRLCEMRIGRTRHTAQRGRSSRVYRVSKFPWVGHPHTKPSIAVRPEGDGDEHEASLYVSWNGATEVRAWVLQSGPTADSTAFINHLTVERQGFETRIAVPVNSERHLRVLALDKDWRFLGHSDSVPRRG